VRWSPSTCRADRRRSSRSPRSKLPRSSLAAVALALTIAGCGGGEDADPPPSSRERASAAPRIEPVRCPAGASNCASATGRIVYVEAVDPDGDGDAHFVVLGDDSVTAPGVSSIDVARELRPDPLPGPGDLLSAAGPVYRGSYGQRQIEATAVRVARR
jgi:hypothetical protein